MSNFIESDEDQRSLAASQRIPEAINANRSSTLPPVEKRYSVDKVNMISVSEFQYLSKAERIKKMGEFEDNENKKANVLCVRSKGL